MEDSCIQYRITEEQAKIICKHFDVDYESLDEYEICEYLDRLIDELEEINN